MMFGYDALLFARGAYPDGCSRKRHLRDMHREKSWDCANSKLEPQDTVMDRRRSWNRQYKSTHKFNILDCITKP